MWDMQKKKKTDRTPLIMLTFMWVTVWLKALRVCLIDYVEAVRGCIMELASYTILLIEMQMIFNNKLH